MTLLRPVALTYFSIVFENGKLWHVNGGREIIKDITEDVLKQKEPRILEIRMVVQKLSAKKAMLIFWTVCQTAGKSLICRQRLLDMWE